MTACGTTSEPQRVHALSSWSMSRRVRTVGLYFRVLIDACPWKAWMASRNAEMENDADVEAKRGVAEGGGASWKFNKNTQGWLLRNMFGQEQVRYSRCNRVFPCIIFYDSGFHGKCNSQVHCCHVSTAMATNWIYSNPTVLVTPQALSSEISRRGTYIITQPSYLDRAGSRFSKRLGFST